MHLYKHFGQIKVKWGKRKEDWKPLMKQRKGRKRREKRGPFWACMLVCIMYSSEGGEFLRTDAAFSMESEKRILVYRIWHNFRLCHFKLLRKSMLLSSRRKCNREAVHIKARQHPWDCNSNLNFVKDVNNLLPTSASYCLDYSFILSGLLSGLRFKALKRHSFKWLRNV